MPDDYRPDDLDLPDLTDPSEVADDLEPEVADGPFSIPYLKPKGAPDLPGSDL
jgi:hypothetical protein